MADSLSDKTLTELVDYYESSAEATQEARAKAERDRDYYDHKQLTDEQLEELAKRKQPPTIINFVHQNVNYLMGVEKRTRTDPKAFPRTPEHEDAAHAASDAIRYVVDKENFDAISSDAYENLLIEGICGAVVEVEPSSRGEATIKIRRIAWDRIFYDHHSRERDFSDGYRGYIRWMDMSEAEEIGKKYGYTGSFADENAQFGETYDDKPSYQKWYDGKRKRVKLSYIWYPKNGVWHHAIYTKSGVIWGPEPCPYEDDQGEPECNFIIHSSLVDRDNNRYGYVRSMISQQDAINKRESKTLHLLSQRQTWSREGAFQDENKAKREMAKPDGHVTVQDGRSFNEDFGILSTGDMATGQFQLLQEAKNDLSIIANTGSISEEGTQSGRALEARSVSGGIQTAIYSDAHKQWKVNVYRSIWNKVRQFWNDEKWVRVTDDEDNLKWVGMNIPVTMAEQLIQQHTGESYGDVREKYQAEIQQAISQNPALGQTVEVENQVAELDVDIIIDEVPDVINIQAEQFMTIAKLAERRGDIPTTLLIEMSQLRNKDQILEKLTGGEEQKEMAAQQQQMAQEIQMRLADVDIRQKEAQVIKTQEEARQAAIENELMLVAPEQPQIII